MWSSIFHWFIRSYFRFRFRSLLIRWRFYRFTNFGTQKWHQSYQRLNFENFAKQWKSIELVQLFDEDIRSLKIYQKLYFFFRFSLNCIYVQFFPFAKSYSKLHAALSEFYANKFYLEGYNRDHTGIVHKHNQPITHRFNRTNHQMWFRV